MKTQLLNQASTVERQAKSMAKTMRRLQRQEQRRLKTNAGFRAKFYRDRVWGLTK